MSLTKIHKISTILAVATVIISCTLLFLSMVDRMLGLNLLPPSAETIVGLAVWAFGSIALGSGAVSVVLSLYRLSDKK